MRLLASAVLIGVLTLAAAPAAPAVAQEAPPALPSVTLPPQMDRVLRDYERLWAAGDAAGLAALFTEDGFALQNSRPPARGRDAIQRAYAQAEGPLRLRALAFAADGNVGYIIGGFAYGEPGAEDVGKFTLTLRREPGGPWLIASDMDNSNRRPRMGPPPQSPALAP